jgi:hypothetical protein
MDELIGAIARNGHLAAGATHAEVSSACLCESTVPQLPAQER